MGMSCFCGFGWAAQRPGADSTVTAIGIDSDCDVGEFLGEFQVLHRPQIYLTCESGAKTEKRQKNNQDEDEKSLLYKFIDKVPA